MLLNSGVLLHHSYDALGDARDRAFGLMFFPNAIAFDVWVYPRSY